LFGIIVKVAKIHFDNTHQGQNLELLLKLSTGLHNITDFSLEIFQSSVARSANV